MIEKDWRLSQDEDGNLCIYYKNPETREWTKIHSIKKPSFNSEGKHVPEKRGCFSRKRNCTIM